MYPWHAWNKRKIQQLTLNSAVTGSPVEHLPASQLHYLLCHYYQDCNRDEMSENYSMNSASNK